MVFYRKYRPQSLNDLFGQEQVKQTLLKAFQSDKIGHAYLFSGPRGTGKTSTARILAKMINCETSGDTIPCNTCASCLSITDGSNLDLIEIDAASNRGIDDIRDLRDRINLSPTSAKKKVYIIDEVHMLTTEAFNALLKTLEEPPSHVIFILATTEVHKLPATILSRVQRLNFELATTSEIVEALKKIVATEKIDIDEESLVRIAQKAGGSFRDSQKILDQLASRNEKITLELIESTINSGSLELIEKLLTAIAKKDTKVALEQITQLTKAGINIKDFSTDVLEIGRLVLLTKHNVTLPQIEAKAVVEKLNTLFSTAQLIRVLSLLQDSLEKLKFTSIESLPLEIAVVESSLEQTASKVSEAVPAVKQVTAVPIVEKNIELPESKAADASVPVVDSFTGSDDSSQKAVLIEKWNYILETVRPYNYSLEALLKQAKVLSCAEGIVILEVPYSFHQRIIEAPKSRNLLESVLADVLGSQVKVATALGNRPVRIEELANVELAADDEIVKIAAEIFNS